jgi:RNA polymerase-binding transcription factor DksA
MESQRRIREVRKCRNCGRPIPLHRGAFSDYCSRSCLYSQHPERKPQTVIEVDTPKDHSKDWSRVHKLLSKVKSENIKPRIRLKKVKPRIDRRHRTSLTHLKFICKRLLKVKVNPEAPQPQEVQGETNLTFKESQQPWAAKKQCRLCGQKKHPLDFRRSIKYPGGRLDWCKACTLKDNSGDAARQILREREARLRERHRQQIRQYDRARRAKIRAMKAATVTPTSSWAIPYPIG